MPTREECIELAAAALADVRERMLTRTSPATDPALDTCIEAQS